MATNIILSPRLNAVALWVPQDSLFADIGTDHGNLPCWLMQRGRVSHAIAADIREGPLNSARTTAARHQISLDFRLCDGLQGIAPHEVTTVAIAGMGGTTITQILDQWKSRWQTPWTGKFLLQPMSTQPHLRQWLNQQDFSITKECTIREGDILYTIMEVEVGKQPPLTLGEQLAGRQWQGLDDPCRAQLLDHLLNKTHRALTSISTVQDNPRQQELTQQKDALIQLKEEWILWNP